MNRHKYVFLIPAIAGVILVLVSCIEFYCLLDHRMETEQVKLESMYRLINDAGEQEERWVDWDRLKAINPDIVAWIYIPDTGVDYPVLGKDLYLDRDVYGNEDASGSIFTYDTANLDADPKMILFGHNLSDGQMFGSLKQYLEADYGHEILYLYTQSGVQRYRFTDARVSGKDDRVYTSDPAEAVNRTLILSTCYGYFGTDRRLLVSFTWEGERFGGES